MHANRILYSLPEYQSILRTRYSNYGVLIHNIKDSTFNVTKPIPATPFLPEGRKKYFAKIYSKMNYINKAKKYTFCTLTYSSSLYTPAQAAKRVKHDLDLFFKRLNYRKSKPEYFYVLELTDKYMVHIHLIFDRYVHKKKIHKSWFKVTGSISTRIKSLSFKNAFEYCTKYITKSKKMNVEKWAFIFGNIDRIWTSSRKFFAKNLNIEKNFIGVGFGSNRGLLFNHTFIDYEKDEISRDLSAFKIASLINMLKEQQLLYWCLPDDELENLGLPMDVIYFENPIKLGLSV